MWLMPPARRLAAAAALALLAGCGPGGAGPERTVPRERVDAAARGALADVERFWARAFPELTGGMRFIPVTASHSYTRAEPPPACDPPGAGHRRDAFYCPAGDFIAWDAGRLVALLLRAAAGPVLVGLAIAHEYGHAVQARLHLTAADDVLERQADCFAGAWLAHAWPDALDTLDATAALREGFARGAPHCATSPL